MIIWIQWLARFTLAGLFIYAGAVKFMHPNLFLSDIESYRMMPYQVAWLVAFYLPPLEILCGIGLVIPSIRKASAILLLLLMISFVMAISIAWARGLNISCGCFGEAASETNYFWLIGRDLIIIGALLFSLITPRKYYENI